MYGSSATIGTAVPRPASMPMSAAQQHAAPRRRLQRTFYTPLAIGLRRALSFLLGSDRVCRRLVAYTSGAKQQRPVLGYECASPPQWRRRRSTGMRPSFRPATRRRSPRRWAWRRRRGWFCRRRWPRCQGRKSCSQYTEQNKKSNVPSRTAASCARQSLDENYTLVFVGMTTRSGQRRRARRASTVWPQCVRSTRSHVGACATVEARRDPADNRGRIRRAAGRPSTILTPRCATLQSTLASRGPVRCETTFRTRLMSATFFTSVSPTCRASRLSGFAFQRRSSTRRPTRRCPTAHGASTSSSARRPP